MNGRTPQIRALVELVSGIVFAVGFFLLVRFSSDFVAFRARMIGSDTAMFQIRAFDGLFLLTVLCIWFIAFSLRSIVRERKTRRMLAETKKLLETSGDAHMRETVRKLKRAQEVAKMGFINLEISTGKIECSSSICGMYGVDDEDEHSIDGFIGLVHPDDRERVSAHIHRLIDGGHEDGEGIDYRIVRRNDKKIVWFHAQAQVLNDEKGKPKALLETIIDISERKKLERDALMKSDEIWQLFDAVPEALFTLHFEREKGNRPIFADVNKGAIKMFRARSRREWVGKSPADISPPTQPDGSNSLERIMDASRRVISGEKMDFEWTHRRFDGTDFNTETSLRPYDIGSERRILVIVRDITVRDMALKERIESERRLRAIVETAQDAIILLGVDGKVRYWNPAAKRIFGYAKDEILNKDLVDFIMPDEFKPRHIKYFLEFQKTGKGNAIGKTVELRGKRKGGAEFPMELSLSSVPSKDGYEAVGIIRDISERKKAEKELSDKNEELRKTIYLMLGREKKMIALKKEMKRLKKERDDDGE